MKLLFGLAFVVCLSGQTWPCVTVSGGVPSISPSNDQACPKGATQYFTQTATFSVSAWNSHYGSVSWGPQSVNVSGNGACNEPLGSFGQYYPSFSGATSNQGNTCTWYAIVTQYINVGGSIATQVSSQGQTSGIPCAPCCCSASDCNFPPAAAACSKICSSK